MIIVLRFAGAAQHHTRPLKTVLRHSKPISPSKVSLLYYHRTVQIDFLIAITTLNL